MADFLTVNKIAISVANESAQVEEQEHGGARSRAHDGTLRSFVQAFKRAWSVETPIETQANLEAIKALARGRGHHWNFDADLYSDKGLNGSANTGTTQTAGSAKFGAGKMTVGATTGTITFAANLGTRWTVMVWRYEGAAWVHYIVTYDGTTTKKWVDGVSNDGASTTWLSVSGGSATIANTTGAAVHYDDLVLLDYVMPTGWAATWGVLTAAFSALPVLSVDGDLIPNGPVNCLGSVGNTKPVQAVDAGAWSTKLGTVALTLTEV